MSDMSLEYYEVRDVMVNSNMMKAVKVAYNKAVKEYKKPNRTDASKAYYARQCGRLLALIELYNHSNVVSSAEVMGRIYEEEGLL